MGVLRAVFAGYMPVGQEWARRADANITEEVYLLWQINHKKRPGLNRVGFSSQSRIFL